MVVVQHCYLLAVAPLQLGLDELFGILWKYPNMPDEDVCYVVRELAE